MKKLVLLLSLWVGFNGGVYAQDLLEEIIHAHEGIETLQARFVMEKEDEMLLEPSISKGQLFFQKAPQKLLWQVDAPASSSMLITVNEMSIKEGDKVKTYAMNKHRMLTVLKSIMVGSLDGSLLKDKDSFDNTVKLEGAQYVVYMKPKKGSMSKLFTEIKMYYHRETGLMEKIILIESEENVSEIVFTNIRKNTPLNADQFKLN